MKQWILLAGTVGLSVAVAVSQAVADEPGGGSALPDSSSVWSWKVQPAVGSRYVMRTFSRSEMQMGGLPNIPTRPGRPKPPTSVASTTRSTSVADYEVLSRDATGATTVKITYRSFDTDSSSVMSNASERPRRAAEDASSKMLKNFMVGVSLTMKIAPDGKIWSVLGLDKLRARMMRAFAGTPGAATIMQSLGGFFSEDTYKKSLSQSMGELPPFALATGDSWPYKISLPLPMGMDSTTQGTRTLLSRRDGVATIRESGTFNLNQNPPAAASAQAAAPAMPRTSMQMRGSSNGSTKVDEASGLPLEANSSMTMSGRISVELPDASSMPKPKPGAAPHAALGGMSMTMSGRVTTRTVMEPVEAPST